MWTLIILAAAGGTVVTQPNLETCQNSYKQANIADVTSAYCQSAAGDRVYIVKDGKPLIAKDDSSPPRG